MTNIINDKFYDFINMYNAIIKHCTNKQRTYDDKLSHINDTLYFKVIDKESKTILHNDNINCTKEESKLIYNMITSEFILNHNLKYAAYLPMDYNDVLEFIKKGDANIRSDSVNYLNNNIPIVTHMLENSIFSLKINLYEGIDEQTEILHQMAIDKVKNSNQLTKIK